jgi:hypothetical protein
MSKSVVNYATDPCVNLAPRCVDHSRNSLWAVGVTLALLALLSVFVLLAAV